MCLLTRWSKLGTSITWEKIAGIIIVILLLGTGTIVFQITKQETVLKKDGVILAKHKWVVNAERTWSLIKYPYQVDSCTKKGGEVRVYASGQKRCYYPDDYYEMLKRSIINTKLNILEETNTSVHIQRNTPYYAYGTRGSYAGNVYEDFLFIDTTDIEEFPKEYNMLWNPLDTRNYRMIWRVYDIAEQPYPDGNYSQCVYSFGDLKVDLKQNCNDLDYCEIKQDKAYFHFKENRGKQMFDLGFVDPYPSGWTKCKNITITNPGSTTLTNFPVSLNVSHDADMQADFDDLRFYTGACNAASQATLYAELEKKTNSVNAYVWVKVNLTSGSNTFSMYYKNSTVASNWDTSGNVWDSDYKAVWHLSTDDDSTSNNNDGTVTGASLSTSGKIADCYSFDGNADYITISDLDYISSSRNWSFSALFYLNEHVDSENVLLFKDGVLSIDIGSNNNDYVRVSDRDAWTYAKSTDPAYVNLTWHQVDIIYNTADSECDFYVNGVKKSFDKTVNVVENNNVLTISRNSAISAFNGYLDEIRISDIERSHDWFNMSYQNKFNYGSFVVFGSEETEDECSVDADCNLCYKCVDGSCVVQTSAEDTKSECGAIQCDAGAGTPYYYGWSGSTYPQTCYYRDDVAAGDAHCDGAGACKTTAVECGEEGIGDSEGSTVNCAGGKVGCTGTTAPTENNTLCLHYVSNSGDDTKDGHTTATAWKTITKVNTIPFTAGDVIYFNKGDIWRCANDAWLSTDNSDSSGYIRYGAYGTGAKPIFKGSTSCHGTGNWTDLGSNRWRCEVTTTHDIGNIVGDSTVRWGKKSSTLVGVNSAGEFYYDTGSDKTTVYSTSNPGSLYTTEIEMGRERTIITGGGASPQYNIFENLHLMYGGSMGLNYGDAAHMIVRNMTFDTIGGAYSGGTTRYGNCVQFIGASDDILVTYNNFTGCYDAAMSPQEPNDGTGDTISNQVYSYNIVVDCLYGFEFFNSIVDGGAETHNISVHHNTIVNTGSGWSGSAISRAYDKGMRLARTPTATTNFTVKDNIIFNSTTLGIDVGAGSANNWKGEIEFDYNLYLKGAGTYLFDWYNTDYTNLAAFKAAQTNESNGVESDPLFTDAANNDFTPQSSTACTMSSTGSYVGAVPCSTVPPSISFDTPPTPANESTIYVDYTTINVTSVDATDHYLVRDFDKDLYAWWYFDNSSDYSDHSSYNNYGTNSGSTYTTSGKFNGGRTFTQWSNINIVNDNLDEDFDALTIAAWIKPSTFSPARWRTPLHRGTQTSVGASTFFIALESSTNQIIATIGSSAMGNAYSAGATGVNAQVDTWYHVVCSWNGTHARVYVDGTDEGGYTMSTATFHNDATATTRIGSSGQLTAYQFDGIVDDVVIVNKGLTLAEVRALYNASEHKYTNEFTGLSFGVHNITVYGIDSEGNKGSTGERWFDYSRNCTVPTEDLSITSDTKFCSGTYYLNDSNTNGAIIIGANNVELDCNGATIYGGNISGSYGIYANNRHNVTVKNCNIKWYRYGIRYYRLYDSKIYNNNLTDNLYNIFVARDENGLVEVYNNTIIMTKHFPGASKSYGVYYENSRNSSCYNNIINLSVEGYGIDLLNPWDDRDEYINVYNNTIVMTESNGIICGNKIEYVNIYNNNITGNISYTGIALQNTSHANVYLNDIKNTGNTLTGDCIRMSYTDNQNNSIYNNTLTDCQRYAFRGYSHYDTTFENNFIYGTNIYDIFTQDFDGSIIDNYYDNGFAIINNNLGVDVSFTVNETSTSYHFVNLSNTGTLNFTYNGRKDFRVVNNTINIYNLASPNDDIYNQTGSTVIAYDVTDYNITIPAGNEIIVGDYGLADTCNCPASGQWSIDCDDACSVSDCNMDGSNLVITQPATGDYTVTLTNFSGYGSIYVTGNTTVHRCKLILN